MRSRDGDFKPIQAEFKLAATAACDYTRRPEVTRRATRHLRLDSSEDSAAAPEDTAQRLAMGAAPHGPGLASL
jgi:hypothetical protein